ncbi:MAG: LapA family protein [Chloroflexi bacterium]|nr:LapA family protein [Chloroflexota bacterium]MBI1856337.1 LapA family protein [Chloroflexota bacterium]MBI2758570.1 LapA family protein [Chloroflexota bacterium]MBI3338572.1 LapA family protein [Chloroflexota bacterium]
MIITLILTIVVTIIAVMFSLENVTIIRITFFGYPVDGSSGLLMLIALGVGVLLGIILMIPSLIGNSWALMRHKRRIAEFEQTPPRKTAKKKS